MHYLLFYPNIKYLTIYFNNNGSSVATFNYQQIGLTSNLSTLETSTNNNISSDVTLTNNSSFINNYTIQWFGYFLPPISGIYTFGLNVVNNNTYVWLGQTALSGYTTGNTLLQTTGQNISNTITLSQGIYYPIRIINSKTLNKRIKCQKI